MNDTLRILRAKLATDREPDEPTPANDTVAPAVIATVPAYDFEATIREMERQAADPARAHYIASLLERFAPTVINTLGDHTKQRQVSFPAYAEIKHLQVSLFDNWKPFGFNEPKGREARKKGGRRARLTVSVELWREVGGAALGEHNRAFTGTGMWFDDSKTLDKHLDTIPMFKTAAGEWAEYRSAMHGQIAGGMMVAPLYSTSAGTSYMLHHFACARRDEIVSRNAPSAQVAIWTPQGWIVVQPFSDKLGSGDELRGNVVLSARLTRGARMARDCWRTGDLDTCFV